MTSNESGATDMPTEIAGEATREAVRTDLQTQDEQDSGAPGSTNSTQGINVDLPGETYELRPDNSLPNLMLNDDQSDEKDE